MPNGWVSRIFHIITSNTRGAINWLQRDFIWPRKEKSLTKPRNGGETPSRTESSCPAWRSHANTLFQALTLALSRKGRGDGYPGAGAGDWLVSAKVATAPDCRYQIAPLTIDLGKGVNRRPSPYYGARVVLSMVLMG